MDRNKDLIHNTSKRFLILEAVTINHCFTVKTINMTQEPPVFYRCCRREGPFAGWHCAGKGERYSHTMRKRMYQWKRYKLPDTINLLSLCFLKQSFESMSLSFSSGVNRALRKKDGAGNLFFQSYLPLSDIHHRLSMNTANMAVVMKYSLRSNK